MVNLFAILVLVTFVSIIVALIKPKVILPKMEYPTRKHAVSLTVMLFVFSFAIWVSFLPDPNDPHVPSPPQMAAVEAAPKSKGIGINRSHAIAMFADQGCHLAKSTDANGQERWMGQDGLMLCEAVGSASDITKIFFLHGVGNDVPTSAIEALTKVVKVLKTMEPEWNEGGNWVANAIKNDSGSTVRNGRQIEVKLMPPLGLSVAVSAVE